MSRIVLPARPRILIVALRRSRDVLLTTPLIGSVRKAWPDAQIEVLVFADTAGILDGNPHANGVIAMPSKPASSDSLALIRRLWRRYDLAISTQPGDRPTFFTWIAGRQRVGPIEDRPRGKMKNLLFHRSVMETPKNHRVEETLRLADAIGIDRAPAVSVPHAAVMAPAPSQPAPNQPYAVIHAAPMFRYKQWTREGWRQLATALAGRGLAVVATGGPSPSEKAYLDDVWLPVGSLVQRLDGKTDWPQLTGLLAGARIYAGPDTSVTHLAAASGCPTLALFGPTDPARWGPWPAEGLDAPWNSVGVIQRRGNVWLVQNPLSCLPCQLEGCERHIGSHSQCLDELSVSQVLIAADQALAAAGKERAEPAEHSGAAAQTPILKAAGYPVRP